MKGMAVAFCSECGTELTPLDRFCANCGTSAPVDAGPATNWPAPPPTTPPAVPEPSATPTSKNRQFALWGGIAACVALVVVGVVLVTRPDGKTDDGSLPNVTVSVPVAEVPTTIAEVPTTAVESTEPSTTLPSTTTPTTTPTTAPPTTPPPTTAAPVPNVPLVPAGWTSTQMPQQAYPKLTESNLSGTPSPTILDYSAPVPDGLYPTGYVSQNGATVTLDLFRFESCQILGMGPCDEGPYAPDDVGISDVVVGTVDIPLDATTTVVMAGWECGEVVAQGNGADLATLYAALAADYEVAFGAGLAAGTDPYDMMTSVNANPVARFGPPPAACNDGYSLQWRFEGAPPALVQWAFDWDTGGRADPAALLIPSAIAVNGDSATIYIYAGFFS
jgi:hypothetical protein